ncbi:MAG TPA: ankyrin repeat domain-containing protein [Allosphingosinicella sp.]|uniref:ankyrin repeat domain-containing protein n=1 Tax=Allosphingosinicella sp. TaxID=2823234 RepID=UPI002ED77A56
MKRKFGSILVAAALASLAAPAVSQNFSDHYSFIKAVKSRDGAKVTSFVQTPGSVVINAREAGTGDGGLHIVARGRDYTWLGFLIGKGARVDLQNNEGMTALAIAAQLGWVEGAQLLLSRRANIDLANSKGETPLILAVQRRDLEMVRLLKSKGANPKKADRVAGYSALDYAKRDARATAILKELEAPVKADKPAIGPGL